MVKQGGVCVINLSGIWWKSRTVQKEAACLDFLCRRNVFLESQKWLWLRSSKVFDWWQNKWNKIFILVDSCWLSHQCKHFISIMCSVFSCFFVASLLFLSFVCTKFYIVKYFIRVLNNMYSLLHKKPTSRLKPLKHGHKKMSLIFSQAVFFLFPFSLLTHFLRLSFLQPTLEMPRVTSQTYAARITIYYPAFAW